MKERVGCSVLPCVREPVLVPDDVRDSRGADVAAIALDDVGVAVVAAVADRDRVPLGDSDGLPVLERDLTTDGLSTLVLDHVDVERCVAESVDWVDTVFDTHVVRETVPVRVAWILLLLGLPDRVGAPLCVLLILGETVELGDPVPVRDSVCSTDPLLVLEEDRVIEGLGVSEDERLGVAESVCSAETVLERRPDLVVDGDAVAVLMEVPVLATELVAHKVGAGFADMEPLPVWTKDCVTLAEPDGLFDPTVLDAIGTEPVSVRVDPGVAVCSTEIVGLSDRISDFVG